MCCKINLNYIVIYKFLSNRRLIVTKYNSNSFCRRIQIQLGQNGSSCQMMSLDQLNSQVFINEVVKLDLYFTKKYLLVVHTLVLLHF